MKAYHATYSSNVEKIKNNGFKYKKGKPYWPGDLGYGVYTYVDPEKDEGLTYQYSAKLLAFLFVSNGKMQSREENIKVLEVQVKEDINLLNLTNQRTKNNIISLKNKLQKMYVNEDILKEYEPSLDKDRNQQDGIFLEYLINHKLINTNPDAVIEDTIAILNDDNTLSNLPNGRELCIRNLDIISNISVVS